LYFIIVYFLTYISHFGCFYKKEIADYKLLVSPL